VGFSPWGVVIAAAVLLPNLTLLVFPPRPALPQVRTSPAWVWLERSGQALCLTVPWITEPGELRWGWGGIALAALVAYGALWGRYLVSGCRREMLYRPWAWMPVPMAILPVLTFLAAAAWLSNPWVAAAAVVLAAGHIPVSFAMARAATE
jgi:hypothetical protein